MTDNLYNEAHAGGLISDESFERLRLKQQQPPLFSLHWEIKTLLYLGVLALTAGLGILIYDNIETLGHQFVLALIALICAGSFTYCIKYRLPFNRAKVKAPNHYFDYVLLLACTSLLIFVGYLQYAYSVFGTSYGLATFISMVVLFGVAYYFDHLGILSMAIVNLALWMGVSVTPRALLLQNDFNSETVIYTYLVLGLALVAGAMLTQRYSFKGHFKFSYQHYGLHVTYIALLAGYFHFYNSPLAIAFMLGVFLLSAVMYFDAYKSKSFYFLLLVILYSYIALSSLVFRALFSFQNGDGIPLMFIYMAGSGVGFIMLLIHLNKALKQA